MSDGGVFNPTKFFGASGSCSDCSTAPACPQGWVDVYALVSAPPGSPVIGAIYLTTASPTGLFSGHGNKYATLSSGTGAWTYCDPVVGDKVTIIGSCAVTCWNGTTFAPIYAAPVMSGENLGNGAGSFFSNWSGYKLQLRRLKLQSSWASLATVGDNVVLTIPTPSGGGSGEVNDGENIGGGAPIYKTKNGLHLQFRTLVASGIVSVAQVGDTIQIGAPAPSYPTWSMVNLGSGSGVFAGMTSLQFNMRSIIGTSPVVVTQNTNDLTLSIAGWSTLVQNDSTSTGARWVASGPPWIIRRAKAGVGMTITENTHEVLYDVGMTELDAGGGLSVFKAWTGTRLDLYTLVAGAGLSITQVGNGLVFDVTSGGGSGPGAAGTALVGEWKNSATTTNVDINGAWTDIIFDGTILSVATFVKGGDNKTFTAGKDGKYRIAVKATLLPGSGQAEQKIRAVVDMGGGYVEVDGSLVYADSGTSWTVRNTVMTVFTVQMSATNTIKFQFATAGGTVQPQLAPYATAVSIEEVVGPILEVIDVAGTTLTLNISHMGKVLRFTSGSAVTVTMPNNMPVSFTVDMIQYGAGVVTCVAGAGATRHSLGALFATAGQYARITATVVLNVANTAAIYNLSGSLA